MVKLQWPIKKQQPSSFIDEPLEKQLRMEAGITAIKGVEYTKLRISHSDEGITEIINLKIKQLNSLFNRQSTEELEKRIEKLQREITLWTFYKQYKRASAPWATAGEDHDMSHRLRQMEIFFFRNLDNPDMWDLVMMALQYVSDICFKEWHVAPAPTVLVQTMNMGNRGWPLDDVAASTKAETVSRN